MVLIRTYHVLLRIITSSAFVHSLVNDMDCIHLLLDTWMRDGDACGSSVSVERFSPLL